MRNGFITFRSPVLQHFFDCPLQFGAVPEHTNASVTTANPTQRKEHTTALMPAGRQPEFWHRPRQVFLFCQTFTEPLLVHGAGLC